MIETYRNLKELAGMYQGTTDTNEIALKYQDTEDATLLAFAFCAHFGIAVTQSEKYFGLNQEDLASFALEEMHKALLHYREDGGGKLVTLYSKFLNTRLRTETQYNGYDKRKGNSNAESFEGGASESDEGPTVSRADSMGYEEDQFTEIELLLSLVNKGELTDNEYRYCEIIIKEISDIGQIKDSEIASRLDISSAAVHYIKKSLQKKIGIRSNTNFALNF